MCWRSINAPWIRSIRSSVWMRPANNSWAKRGFLYPLHRASRSARITSTSDMVWRIFFFFPEPLPGGREVRVTERRPRADWAEAMRELSDRCYPAAERITVVLDNLNTHGPASFYEGFAPAEARRLTERFDFHYTPKHGSWLNMAEIEFSVLSRQCLNRRINDAETLRNETQAWQQERNAGSNTIDWQFTTANARIKLKRLYPVIKT